MLYYDRVDISKGVDLSKSNNSKESMICYYFFLIMDSTFNIYISDGCNDLTILCLNMSSATIITVKSVD